MNFIEIIEQGKICVQTRQYRKTPCFRVYKEENKEE